MGTDPRSLQRFVDYFKFGSVIVQNYSDGRDRTCYRWRVFGENAATVLRRLVSRLTVKQDQAQLILYYRSLEPGDSLRSSLVEAVSALKKITY